MKVTITKRIEPKLQLMPSELVQHKPGLTPTKFYGPDELKALDGLVERIELGKDVPPVHVLRLIDSPCREYGYLLDGLDVVRAMGCTSRHHGVFQALVYDILEADLPYLTLTHDEEGV